MASLGGVHSQHPFPYAMHFPPNQPLGLRKGRGSKTICLRTPLCFLTVPSSQREAVPGQSAKVYQDHCHIMSPHRLKAMTTLSCPVLCTFTTDAPSFLLSLAGKNPRVSVAMAIMYQKPENCGGSRGGRCWSCYTMLPVQAPS